MPSFNLGAAIRDAKPGSFEPLPEDKYRAKVSSVAFKNSSNGNPMFSVQFKVTEGEFENRTLFRNIAFTEKSIVIAVETLARLGFTDQELLAEALDGSGDPSEVIRQLLDAEAELVVTQREYNGKITNDVKYINSLPGASSNGSVRASSAPPARPF